MRASVRRAMVRSAIEVTALGLASTVGLASTAAHASDTATDRDGVQAVVVTGKPSLAILTQKLRDTPQTIDVVPQQVMKEQAVNNLQDALKNIPGITLNAGEGGAHGDQINLRGFPASDDYFLDGLRDTGFYTRDSFDLDVLEVYKGPASTLFGRGSTGGVVNQVSKTPQLLRDVNATFTAGTNDEQRATVDINVPLSDDAAIRLNAMGQTSGVAGRDFVHNRRYGIAPSLALGIDKPTSLTVSLLHQQEDNIPDYGIPFVFGAPAPVPRNTDYQLPSDDRFASTVDIATARLKHSFNDAVTLTEAARYGRYSFDSRQTAAHYGAAPPVPGTPLSAIVVFRDRPSSQGAVTTAMSSTDLSVRASTGPVTNTLVLGLEVDREEAALVRFVNQMNLIAPTPLLHPDPNEAFPGRQTAVTQRPDTVTNTLSGVVGDTIQIGEHWQVIGAVRLDRFSANFSEPVTHAAFRHTDVIASPRASVVFKPTEQQSLYFTYGSSYDPSAENLSLSARTVDLGPEKDHTFEFGAKTELLNGSLTASAALFRTEMVNVRVGDPTNPSLQILAGTQRVDGLELGLAGYITPGWEVLAGYTHLISKTLKSTDPTQVGQPLQNTAPNQANLWTVYRLTPVIKVGGGINYLDRRPADVANSSFTPSYVTLDAMASLRVNDHLSLQVNATNLTDKYYFANSYFTKPVENHVLPGPGRTVTFTVAADF